MRCPFQMRNVGGASSHVVDGQDADVPAVARQADAEVGVLRHVVGVPAADGFERRARKVVRRATERHRQLQPLERRQNAVEQGGVLDGELDHVGHAVRLHKLPLRGYLAAVAIFCNEVKGKSTLAPCRRDLGLSYKTAFVLAHKLREAMAEEMKGREIGDDAPRRRSTAPTSAAT